MVLTTIFSRSFIFIEFQNKQEETIPEIFYIKLIFHVQVWMEKLYFFSYTQSYLSYSESKKKKEKKNVW